jgi:opacity protein-like surface antigen
MFRTAGIALVILLFAGVASAQVPSGNIFFGYSYENSSSTALNLEANRANLQGWEASLEGKWLPWVGILADFSGHYGSENATALTPNGPVAANVTGHELELMFGPRVSVAVGKFTPFAEIMGGVGHMNTGGTFPGPSDTSFASAVGGGIDYRVFRPIAVRLEGDYVTTRFFGNTQNNLRLSTGVVFRF